MERHETTEDIDQAAADWAARLDGGAMSDADRILLDEWASADPRRLGALARAMAILAQFDADPVAVSTAARFRPAPPLARRGFLYGGAAAAAAAVSLTAGVAYAHRGQYRTGKGEVRAVPLADGSRIWLNTDSLVKVRYGRTQRGVILARGEALFEVAKDATRPFVVMAGDASVRAIGTAFSVSQQGAGGVQVMVDEGQVDFADASRKPVRLIPGCRAHAGASGGIAVQHVGVDNVGRALSWRRGMLDFDGDTLAEAVTAFARYSDQRIIIDDPGAARRKVTGLFAASDPAGFARAVALAEGLHARVAEDGVHLSS